MRIDSSGSGEKMKEPMLTDRYARFAKGMEIILEHPEIKVGTTPHEVVHRDRAMRLLHFAPVKKVLSPVPVLIVWALVNRYYILDLQTDKSVIGELLDAGLDVYAIDWGYPSQADRYLTIDDYVNDLMDNAVDILRNRSGFDQITLMGVCQGGTFSLMYASLHQEKLRNLVTVVTPVDFDTDKGLLNIWAKHLDVDKIVDYYGIVPADVLNASYLLVDPYRNMIDKYVRMFDRLKTQDGENARRENEETIMFFLRMEKWIFDSPDQAGEAYRQFIKDLYQKNLLIKNELMLDGKRIDLKKISLPLMTVMAKYDNLVPNDSTVPLMEAVSSTEKESVVFPTGHIGLFVGDTSHAEGWPRVIDWISSRSSSEETALADPEPGEQAIDNVQSSKSSSPGSRSRKRTASRKGIDLGTEKSER